VWRYGLTYNRWNAWFHILSHLRFNFTLWSTWIGLCIHKIILVDKLKPFRYFGTSKKNPNKEQRLYHMVVVLNIAHIVQVTVAVSLYAFIRALLVSNLTRTPALLKEIFLCPSRKTLNINSTRHRRFLPDPFWSYYLSLCGLENHSVAQSTTKEGMAYVRLQICKLKPTSI
jgi:hypothetical protein